MCHAHSSRKPRHSARILANQLLAPLYQCFLGTAAGRQRIAASNRDRVDRRTSIPLLLAVSIITLKDHSFLLLFFFINIDGSNYNNYIVIITAITTILIHDISSIFVAIIHDSTSNNNLFLFIACTADLGIFGHTSHLSDTTHDDSND